MLVVAQNLNYAVLQCVKC